MTEMTGRGGGYMEYFRGEKKQRKSNSLWSFTTCHSYLRLDKFVHARADRLWKLIQRPRVLSIR